MHGLIVYGVTISQDPDGYVSLTDLWRVAGKNDSKRPNSWIRLPTTEELVEALTQNARFSRVIAETLTKSAVYTKQGKGGGTYAHHILALAYAEYLHPDIGIEVREIALRYWSGDVTLFDDFARQRSKQFDDDNERVFIREETRGYNRVFTTFVSEVGTGSPSDLAEFHNAGYRGLYDGEDENAIHKRKRLRKDQRILDYMTTPEAAANLFRVTTTDQRLRCSIDYGSTPTLKDICDLHHDTGKQIRDLLAKMSCPMPETLPTADSISDARRRIAAYRRSLKKKAVPGAISTEDK